MGNTFYKKITSHGSINIPRVLRTEMGLEEGSGGGCGGRQPDRGQTLYLAAFSVEPRKMSKNFKNKGICGECRAYLQEEKLMDNLMEMGDKGS